jgi:hypothetical protein
MVMPLPAPHFVPKGAHAIGEPQGCAKRAVTFSSRRLPAENAGISATVVALRVIRRPERADARAPCNA